MTKTLVGVPVGLSCDEGWVVLCSSKPCKQHVVRVAGLMSLICTVADQVEKVLDRFEFVNLNHAVGANGDHLVHAVPVKSPKSRSMMLEAWNVHHGLEATRGRVREMNAQLVVASA